MSRILSGHDGEQDAGEHHNACELEEVKAARDKQRCGTCGSVQRMLWVWLKLMAGKRLVGTTEGVERKIRRTDVAGPPNITATARAASGARGGSDAGPHVAFSAMFGSHAGESLICFFGLLVYERTDSTAQQRTDGGTEQGVPDGVLADAHFPSVDYVAQPGAVREAERTPQDPASDRPRLPIAPRWKLVHEHQLTGSGFRQRVTCSSGDHEPRVIPAAERTSADLRVL